MIHGNCIFVSQDGVSRCAFFSRLFTLLEYLECPLGGRAVIELVFLVFFICLFVLVYFWRWGWVEGEGGEGLV